MGKIMTISFLILNICFFNGCASKEERLLKLQHEQEIQLEKLRQRSTKSTGENVISDIMDFIF